MGNLRWERRKLTHLGFKVIEQLCLREPRPDYYRVLACLHLCSICPSLQVNHKAFHIANN